MLGLIERMIWWYTEHQGTGKHFFNQVPNATSSLRGNEPHEIFLPHNNFLAIYLRKFLAAFQPGLSTVRVATLVRMRGAITVKNLCIRISLLHEVFPNVSHNSKFEITNRYDHSAVKYIRSSISSLLSITVIKGRHLLNFDV